MRILSMLPAVETEDERQEVAAILVNDNHGVSESVRIIMSKQAPGGAPYMTFQARLMRGGEHSIVDAFKAKDSFSFEGLGFSRLVLVIPVILNPSKPCSRFQ